MSVDAECSPADLFSVPPPCPPDDSDAWYAPKTRAQYTLSDDVVATITEQRDGFHYSIREPVLSATELIAFETIQDYFEGARLKRPLTREGARERLAAGFEPKYERAIDRLTDLSPAGRRRVSYHALCQVRCLSDLTAFALDEHIEVADAADDGLLVHTTDFAPATTDLPPNPDYLSRFASERLGQHTVTFHDFEVPVVIYKEHVLGNDPFTTKYAVIEPDLLPGDEQLIDECKERIWEANVDGVVEDRVGFVSDRARTFLSRRLTARNTRAWLDATRYRMQSALAEYGFAVPPVDERYAADRLSDLVYYVMRDYVGYGKLTIPIRDPMLEDIEANRVGERIKVVPRGLGDHTGRMPANLTFTSERSFVNVVTQLAAADGTELNASTPSAKVNLQPAGLDDETIRCAVALPTISEDGPHISIRKQAPDTLTPVDLVSGNSLSTELVTLLWMLYEHRGVVLFSGPTGVGKTTLMNAHMPFIPYRDRPISIDEGSREVHLPHETGVSLTTRDHENEFKRVTMADLMTECNYLNPDVEVIAEINTPASFKTFAESMNTGHGLLGTLHAEDVHKLVNRIIERGIPAYLLQEIDLVVFPRNVDGERYVSSVIEFVDVETYATLDHDRCGTIEKDGTTIYWNTVAWRDHNGEFGFNYTHPQLGDDTRDIALDAFASLAERTDRPVRAVEDEFHRKHRYVKYLVQENLTDMDELFSFLANLRTNEAATVERVVRRQQPQEVHIDGGRD
ncbi:type II/IV secretion system ATPase subunit [Haladaptatus sp. CMSO5]|uniref:type II/IV secretion system ATPase subunit n=1 Tax=Haladaptatus sp. CMSO5 TaxID=3120514 RepID=UPI002FCDE4F9